LQAAAAATSRVASRQVLADSGYEEDHYVSNVKIGLGTFTCAAFLQSPATSCSYKEDCAAAEVESVRRCLLALLAQFYPKKWPAQWWVMLVCVLAYGACTLALNAFVSRVEGDAFLFTRPRKARAGSPDVLKEILSASMRAA